MDASVKTTTIIQLEAITTDIGVTMEGLDLSRRQSADTAAHLRALLHDHGLLVCQAQALDDDIQKRFAENFGELHVYPYTDHWADRHVAVVNSDTTPAHDYRIDRWHTDATFEQCPPSASVMRCSILPTSGGDTLWASMYAAYESLSSKLQRLLDGLEAVHSSAAVMAKLPTNRSGSVMTGQTMSAIHPVVIVDPVTGRRAVYVNSNYTTEILGFKESESTRILELLFDVIANPDIQVRLKWTAGTLVVWEERITQHRAVGRHVGRREVRRVTVRGDQPIGIGSRP